MNTQTTQNSVLEKHSFAIRTVAAFSGIKLEEVEAEFQKRLHA